MNLVLTLVPARASDSSHLVAYLVCLVCGCAASCPPTELFVFVPSHRWSGGAGEPKEPQ